MRSYHGTYKLEQKRVFPEGSDAPSEAQDEHDPSDHHEEPDRVQAPQVCDGRDVGENTLVKQSEGLDALQEKSFYV